jgi:hypothetical protein
MNPAFLLIALFIRSSAASVPQLLDESTTSPAAATQSEVASAAENVQPAAALKQEPATTDRSSQASRLLPVRAPNKGVRADLFSGHSWYTPPPPRPEPVRNTAPVIRTPTAPPLPFEYIGRYEQAGAGTLYYLVKGDRVYDVKIGDVIDNTYSVEKVANGQLFFTYLPLNSSQGLRLGDQ